MARELAIEYIGPSDEDRAHLRLLMRKLAGSLSVQWHWTDEHRADALFIDPATLAGQMARSRAQEGGARCILLGLVSGAARGELVLQRPFRADALRMALELVAAAGDLRPATVAPSVPLALEPDPELDLPAPDAGLLAVVPARRPRLPGPTHDDAEALFRRQFEPERPAARVVAPPLATVGVAAAEAPTARSVLRGAEVDAPLRNPAVAPLRAADRVATRRLKDYLDGTLLGGPSRIEHEGLAPLVLDPKEQAFHADAPLASLLPWLRVPIDARVWQPLTSAQLRQVREAQPARDYQQLRWLDALHGAGGQLPRRLDPGGSFRLSGTFIVADDFPAQQRIALALANPIRLHELAAAARVPMAQVFDAVAALDAIGLIECRPRERLQRPMGANAPAGGGGLLARALASITVPRGGA
jgi:hypothetical protein